MGKDKKCIYIIFIIIISISVTNCSTNYLGHYYDRNNSSTYNSEIEISHNYLIYNASSDMLGTVIQKEKYLVNKDSIIVDFKIDSVIKSFLVSSFDSKIHGVKIILLSVLPNDSIAPVVNVIVNDSIKYMSGSNDTILNIKKLKKIEFKDVGLNFIKDTTINFSSEKNNVFEIRLKSKNGMPVLNEKGTVRYLIKGKKLYVLRYDNMIKKYVKNDRYYLKK